MRCTYIATCLCLDIRQLLSLMPGVHELTCHSCPCVKKKKKLDLYFLSFYKENSGPFAKTNLISFAFLYISKSGPF